MFKIILIASLVILFSAFSPKILATQTLHLSCFECKSGWEMNQRAVDKIRKKDITQTQDYDVHVGSIKYGTVRSFRITATPSIQWDGEIDTKYTINHIQTPYKLTSEIRNLHSNIRDLIEEIEVPTDADVPSAWNVAQNSSVQSSLSKWIDDSHATLAFMGRLSDFLSMFDSFPADLSGAEITLKFPDGSTAIFSVTSVKSRSATFVYMPNSARDKDGNKIPDQGTSSVAGEYDFSSQLDFNHFKAQLDLRGYKVVVTSFSTLASGKHRVTITDIKRN